MSRGWRPVCEEAILLYPISIGHLGLSAITYQINHACCNNYIAQCTPGEPKLRYEFEVWCRIKITQSLTDSPICMTRFPGSAEKLLSVDACAPVTIPATSCINESFDTLATRILRQSFHETLTTQTQMTRGHFFDKTKRRYA